MEYLNECFYFCADLVAWYENKSYVIYSLNYHSSNNSKHFFQGFYPKKPVTIEFLAWKILKVYIAKKFRAHGSYNHPARPLSNNSHDKTFKKFVYIYWLRFDGWVLTYSVLPFAKPLEHNNACFSLTEVITESSTLHSESVWSINTRVLSEPSLTPSLIIVLNFYRFLTGSLPTLKCIGA